MKECRQKKKTFMERSKAETLVSMLNYSEAKKGRPQAYFSYPCDTCNAWHVLKGRVKRESRTV